jgi:hypothetical protein
VDGINNYTCACQPGYTGRNCQVKKTSVQKAANANDFLYVQKENGKENVGSSKKQGCESVSASGSAFGSGSALI